MPAAVQNITIEQGATWPWTLELHSASEAGPVLDLTGYTAHMQVRSTVDSATVLTELSTSNGRITITAGTGLIELLLTAEQTAALNFESAVYDLELRSADGYVLRLFKGEITLDPEVTRE
ncbi:MAG: hypothetical protein ACKVIH_04105 [Burkholderiales bacterium]